MLWHSASGLAARNRTHQAGMWAAKLRSIRGTRTNVTGTITVAHREHAAANQSDSSLLPADEKYTASVQFDTSGNVRLAQPGMKGHTNDLREDHLATAQTAQTRTLTAFSASKMSPGGQASALISSRAAWTVAIDMNGMGAMSTKIEGSGATVPGLRSALQAVNG